MSPASHARRPMLEPARAAILLLLALAVAIAGIELLATRGLGAAVAPSLHVAVFFVAYDVAIGTVLLAAVRRRLRLDRRAVPRTSPVTPPDAPPPISVLIAAYNEAGGEGDRGIVATLRGVIAQRGVTVEVLVGDDGSEDRTYGEIVEAFALVASSPPSHAALVGGVGGAVQTAGRLRGPEGAEVVVKAFRFPHSGKGATLNALAKHASHGVLVTMDADTSPAEGALAHLAAAFVDPEVESAAGVVTVRNAGTLLTRHQHAEYLKNSIVRIGWSALGGLEQVPGAFAGVRADAFREVDGFPTDSLTEDYELTYRLVQRGVARGRVPVVVTVPQAQAFTDVPVTLRGFVRQRTRWFAGFLSTLFRFRHLIFARAAGGFGLVRLPLKVVDAVLPLIAFASLAVILRGASSPIASISRVALGIFLVRWLWDLLFYAVARSFARELGDRAASERAAPTALRGWMCAATEAVTYVWLKHASTLRAYAWAARGVTTWEPSREGALAIGPIAGDGDRVDPDREELERIGVPSVPSGRG